MFQAELILDQEKECVVSSLAERFDTSFEIAVEELHDHQVTFVIKEEPLADDLYDQLEAADEVDHLERLNDGNILVTKSSCGAYSAIDRNHGILRRHGVVGPSRRVYTVLFFRREDLRAMIDDFREIGTVSLGNIKKFNQTTSSLTDRQHEVIQHALDRGYFSWPREIDSHQLADELEISRATMLEHLRKAQEKLLSKALDDSFDRPRRSDTAVPKDAT